MSLETGPAPQREPLLSIEGLSVEVEATGVELLRGVDLEVGKGELVGLVGESGSGKSLTVLAVLSLLAPGLRRTSGRVRFDGGDVAALDPRGLRRLRGGRIGLVFQDPSSALDPVATVGAQIVETVRAHRPMSRKAARDEAIRLLELVALPAAGQRYGSYPHQLSGGQRQRVLIALALAGSPELLLADEPTTALDVTIQAQILELLVSLQRELGLGVLLVTHDLGVVGEATDRVAVMYAGRVVETGETARVLAEPLHPYTAGLLAAVPRLGAGSGPLPAIPGRPPEPSERPPGCAYHPRCPEAQADCRTTDPDLAEVAPSRLVRCLRRPVPEGGGA